jgi:hypothetical protein
MDTLRQQLSDWTGFDGAMHSLALSLGLVSPQMDFCTTLKHVYWSSNPIGNMLDTCLQEMVKTGVLEEDSDGRYRWSPSFKGDWERDQAA